MKRFLCLVLALLLGLGPVGADVCTSTAVCQLYAGGQACDAGVAGSWDCGHVPISGDTWSILSGYAMALRGTLGGGNDVLSGRGAIAGELYFEPGSANRDANGFRNVTYACPAGGDTIQILPGGRLTLRMDDRIKFDSTAAECMIRTGNGGLFDGQGETTATFIPANLSPGACTGAGAPYAGCTGAGTCGALGCAIAASTDHATCNNTDGVSGGRKYVFQVNALPFDATAASLKYRRVVFNSGKAKNRHYEIVAADVGLKQITVCTDLKDSATSAGTTGLTGGQRLTPHATLATRTRPLAKHTQPAPGPNSSCRAANGPENYGCCTAAAAGFCNEALPAAGDYVTVVRDWWLQEVAGSNGIAIMGDSGGNDPLPTIRAGNINPLAADAASTNATVQFLARSNGQYAPAVTYMNIHDTNTTIPLSIRGWQNTEVAWNAVHDQGPNSAITQSTIYVLEGIVGLVNTHVHNNIIYRGKDNHLTYGGDTSTLEATGGSVYENLIFQGCVTGGTLGTECRAIEIDASLSMPVHNDVIYDMASDANEWLGNGAIATNADNREIDIYDEWIVNTGPGPIRICPTCTATHNYVSHSRGPISEDFGGSWYGNLFRNVNLACPEAGGSSNCGDFLLINPTVARGNYFLGVEDAIVGTADCTGAATQCPTFGITFTSGRPVGSPLLALQDNVFSGMGPRATSAGLITLDSNNDPNYSATFAHLTFDNRARANTRRLIQQSIDLGTCPHTFRLEDSAFLRANNAELFNWSGAAPCIDQSINNASQRAFALADRGGPPSGVDTEAGPLYIPDLGYINPAAHNFNLRADSPLIGAGSSPAGSPVGVRAFRFNRARLTNAWGGLLTFDGEQPVDIANVDNSDTDGDGVIDLHDVCVFDFDPGQHDADADGVGDACE